MWAHHLWNAADTSTHIDTHTHTHTSSWCAWNYAVAFHMAR